MIYYDLAEQGVLRPLKQPVGLTPRSQAQACRPQQPISLSLYIYIYIHVYMSTYVYIYI